MPTCPPRSWWWHRMSATWVPNCEHRIRFWSFQIWLHHHHWPHLYHHHWPHICIILVIFLQDPMEFYSCVEAVRYLHTVTSMRVCVYACRIQWFKQIHTQGINKCARVRTWHMVYDGISGHPFMGMLVDRPTGGLRSSSTPPRRSTAFNARSRCPGEPW